MDEKSLEKVKEIAKQKGISEEDAIKAVEAMEQIKQIKQIVAKAWEAIKETIKNIVEYLSENRQPLVPKMPLPPIDTTKVSQVMNRKPMVLHIRNNI